MKSPRFNKNFLAYEGFETINGFFLKKILSTYKDYQTYLNTTLVIFVIHMFPNMSPYILLG
jgi:hypothetical protein